MKRDLKFKELLLVAVVLSAFNLTIAIPTKVLSINTTRSTLDSLTLNENEIIDNEIGELDNVLLKERAKYAMKMLSYMNQTVDPCDDFYEYACGNWKNVIDERQTVHKRCNILDTAFKLNDVVKELIEQQKVQPDAMYAEELRLMLQYYDTCLAADLYPFKSSSAYLAVIKEIGGFPALDDEWNPDEFSWFNMSSHLTNYGADGLINEKIIPQYPFPPYFELPELGFDSNVHTDNIASNQTNAYKLNEARMRGYLEGYGVSSDKATVIIAGIFDFWRAVLQIADVYKEDAILCQAIEPTRTPNVFEQWQNHFDIAWNGIDFNIMDDDCPCEYFYLELDNICNEHKTAVANYLAMKFLFAMDAKLKRPEFQVETCVMAVRYGFPYLIDQLYLKAYFNKDIEQEVSALVKELHKSMHLAIKDAEWLDENIRTDLLRRESEITSRIGKYDDPALVSMLINEMRNLTLSSDNYEQNKVNVSKFKVTSKRYLGLHHNSINNETKPLELLIGMQVQAFFYLVDNSINVMAGILHPPAYHKSWPNILKFATIGYLVGHELTHGFDSNGAYHDHDMLMHNFTAEANAVFKERVDCFVNHYNEYLIPQINRYINGNLTKDENIADSGGLHHALSAYYRYMKQLSKTTDEPVYKHEYMPGIDLSPEQLFFLGYAQLWCADYKEEHYWEELTNVHTMDKYRVLGAVTNMEPFAKAYKCPLGSNMNPKPDKCRLW